MEIPQGFDQAQQLAFQAAAQAKSQEEAEAILSKAFKNVPTPQSV